MLLTCFICFGGYISNVCALGILDPDVHYKETRKKTPIDVNKNDGIRKEYSPNGQLWRETLYKDSSKVWTHFYGVDGTISIRLYYKNGQIIKTDGGESSVYNRYFCIKDNYNIPKKYSFIVDYITNKIINKKHVNPYNYYISWESDKKNNNITIYLDHIDFFIGLYQGIYNAGDAENSNYILLFDFGSKRFIEELD